VGNLGGGNEKEGKKPDTPRGLIMGKKNSTGGMEEKIRAEGKSMVGYPWWDGNGERKNAKEKGSHQGLRKPDYTKKGGMGTKKIR